MDAERDGREEPLYLHLQVKLAFSDLFRLTCDPSTVTRDLVSFDTYQLTLKAKVHYDISFAYLISSRVAESPEGPLSQASAWRLASSRSPVSVARQGFLVLSEKVCLKFETPAFPIGFSVYNISFPSS